MKKIFIIFTILYTVLGANQTNINVTLNEAITVRTKSIVYSPKKTTLYPLANVNIIAKTINPIEQKWYKLEKGGYILGSSIDIEDKNLAVEDHSVYSYKKEDKEYKVISEPFVKTRKYPSHSAPFKGVLKKYTVVRSKFIYNDEENGKWIQIDKEFIPLESVEDLSAITEINKHEQEVKEVKTIKEDRISLAARDMKKNQNDEIKIIEQEPISKLEEDIVITKVEENNNQCKIDFDSLVKSSLKRHPSILMSKSMLDSTLAELDSKEWELFPTVSLNYDYKSSDKNKIVATVEQPIWTGGKISAEINKAYAQKDEATASLDEAKLKLIDVYLKTIKDYMQSKSKLAIVKDNLDEYEKISMTFQRMMQAGILSQADKNLFNSKIASLKSEQIIANSKLDISIMKLELLSDESIDCDVYFENRSILNYNDSIRDLAELLDMTHPTLKVFKNRLKSIQEDLILSKSIFWPKLSIKGEHRHGALYKTSEDEDENIAYASLSVNFGAGLSSFSNVAKARAEINKIKMEILSKKKDLTDRLVDDYMNFVKSKEYTKILLKDVWTATQIYNSNKRLFESQKKSWLDLVNSYSELSRQKIKYEEQGIENIILEYLIALESGLIDLNTFGIKK